MMIAGSLALGAFVFVHGRVGLDDPHHQPTTLSLGNLAISLVIAGIVFFPLHLSNRGAAIRWVRRNLTLSFGIVSMALVVGLTYHSTHPWNYILEMLRNQLIRALTESWSGRLSFAAVMFAVIVSVRVTPLVVPAARLIYAFWFLVLLPVLLVEPRYFIGAFVLFIVLRQAANWRLECALWGWMIFLGVWLNQGLTAEMFLL